MSWWVMLVVLLVGVGLRPRPVARRPIEQASHAPTLVGEGIRPQRRRRLRLPTARAATPAAEVAAWCDRLGRAVRGGTSLAAAIMETPPPPTHVETVVQVRLALDRGRPLSDAIEVSATGSNDLDLALLVLRACARHGGPPAEPIDRAAAALRARAAAVEDRRTQSAQARLSAVVMTLLPLAMLLVLVISSASVRSTLTTPVGIVVVTGGLLLNAIGWRWMRRIIDGRRR